MREKRSVRNYRSQMPPQELINEVLQAGLYAASGKGRQASVIVAIINADVRSACRRSTAKSADGRRASTRFTAPVVLAV
ncbi:MAG: nitroreductase family protein [Ndongobacter sp.]|nr:nitroreductase family protein [Ndongobacter sp.]